MEKFFYRFRSTDRLLDGSHELEQQEIFFASPKELNDPLDGFKDIVWRGDEILWSNLLKHYMLCLMHTAIGPYISPDHIFADSECFIFANQGTFPTPEFGMLYDKICQMFFQHEDIANLPALLASRNSSIRRDELTTYLRMVHLHALNAVLTGMEEANCSPVRPKDDPVRAASLKPIPCCEILNKWSLLERDNPDKPGIVEVLTASAEGVAMQFNLISEYNGTSLRYVTAWKFVVSEFTRKYVEELEQLLYRECHTACFVEDHTQAAMWGNYGDGHKGICLKFKASSNSSGAPSLKLNQICGCRGDKSGSTPVYGDVAHEFCKVEYVPQFIEIDFFCSLGRLTGPMLRYWFYDSAGNASYSVQGILSESDRWREQYWKQFDRAITTKLKDWAHENEFRLTYITDSTDPPARKLKYNFEDLQGIIFGIKTSTTDKLKIMHIIENKCRKEGRKDFEFHQAYYSRLKGKIETTKLSLLKFA